MGFLQASVLVPLTSSEKKKEKKMHILIMDMGIEMVLTASQGNRKKTAEAWAKYCPVIDQLRSV